MASKSYRNKTIDQWCFILIQLLVPVAFGFLAIVLGQDTSWDLQNYHLYNAYSFLHGRFNFDLLPAGWVNCLNPYLDLLYFVGIRHLHPWIVGFVLGFIQGLNFIVLLHICKYCLRSINLAYTKWAMAVAFCGVLSIGFLSEVGTVYWDNVISLFLLISLFIVLSSMNSIVSGKRSAFYFVALAGIVAGMGAGLKMIAIPYALSMILSFFIIPIPWKRRLIMAVLLGTGLAIGLMLTDGAWLWYVWHQMGNPIFPMMNNIFHGELAPNVPIHDVRSLPQNFFEEVFFPIIITVNPSRIGDHHFIPQISWLIVYLVSISFFLSKIVHFLNKRKTDALKPEIKYLLSFFWLSFLFWLNMFSGYRYQITIEILIPIVLLVILLSTFKFDLLTPLIIVAMLGFITFFNIHRVPNWGHSNWRPKAFEIKTTWAQRGKVDSVVLISEPLSWLIPALDIKAPFIQIMPNATDQSKLPSYFPVNEAYFQRAKSMLKNSRNGKILVIFQPWWISPDYADGQLERYGLALKREGCTNEIGYIGTQGIPFMFCPAERM